jgi:hypothetical protein
VQSFVQSFVQSYVPRSAAPADLIRASPWRSVPFEAAVGAGVKGMAGIEVGDEIEVDTSDLVAFGHLHRHIVKPACDDCPWRTVDGHPMHPQRPLRIDIGNEDAAPRRGRFEGRMIWLQHATDLHGAPSRRW